MKKYTMASVVLASFLGLAAAAQAADLKNMDDVSYTIYIETDDATKTLVIGPNETIKDICSDCYIGIEDNDAGISVEKEATVTIKGGQFAIEE